MGRHEENERNLPEKSTRPKSVRPIIYLALIAVILVAVCIIVTSPGKKKITKNMIMEKIENASELTSAKMVYTGLMKYSDGRIPFINQEAFSMIYSATIRAGINVEDLDVDIGRSKVVITVPKVEVLDISIDEDSIEFYDKKFALFKDDSKDDVVEAMREIKKELQEKTDVENLKVSAKQQIETLLVSLLGDSLGNKKLEIVFRQ